MVARYSLWEYSQGVPELTTTSFCLLALLALRSWTTYELAKQMERSLRHVWPRAESKLYEEPKKLVAVGYATARREHTGRRASTVYRITPKGLRALAAWLDEPGAPAVLDFEAIVKIAFADHGSRAGLLANIDAVAAQTADNLALGRRLAEDYLQGRGPFPERLAYSGLMWRYLWELNSATARWAQWARTEVAMWPPDPGQPDPLESFRAVVAGSGLLDGVSSDETGE
jgi:PadR family transcriptional regulator, regulatory protein AphA